MRIEILHSEQEALERIRQLHERGIRENQLSVIHDTYREIPAVEETTDVDTIEVREDQRDESVFDRFVNWVSGRDTLDHLFRKFDVAEQDQNLYYQAVHDGKILLAVEEDEAIAGSTFRSAHIGERPEEERPVGDTEPVDPFIGGTHHPDGTTGSVASADPYAGSAPEFDDNAPPDPLFERRDEGLIDEPMRDAEDYRNYRPREDRDEHLHTKEEREAYLTRGEGAGRENLRIDEPNYVSDEDLMDQGVRPPDSERPEQERYPGEGPEDYARPRFDADGNPHPEDEFIHREEQTAERPRREGDAHLRLQEENYVSEEDLRRPEEDISIQEQARREELNEDERRRYEDGEIADSDLRKPGEPLFGDGPKPPGYDKDEIPRDETDL